MIEFRKILKSENPEALAIKATFDETGDRAAFTASAKQVVLNHRRSLSVEPTAPPAPVAEPITASEPSTGDSSNSPKEKANKQRKPKKANGDSHKSGKTGKRWEPKKVQPPSQAIVNEQQPEVAPERPPIEASPSPSKAYLALARTKYFSGL